VISEKVCDNQLIKNVTLFNDEIIKTKSKYLRIFANHRKDKEKRKKKKEKGKKHCE